MQRYSLLNIRVSPWSLSYRHECSKVIINHLGDGMAMDRVDACTPSLSTARCSTDATLYTNEAEKRLANRNRNERSMADSTLPEDMGNCVDTVVRRTSNFLRKVAAGRSVLPKDLLRKVSLTIANGPHLAVDLDERNSFKYLCMIHEQTRGVCFSASSLASRPVSVDSHNQKAWAKRSKFI